MKEGRKELEERRKGRNRRKEGRKEVEERRKEGCHLCAGKPPMSDSSVGTKDGWKEGQKEDEGKNEGR